MRTILALFLFGVLMETHSADAQRLTYPQTKRVDVVETLHGVEVADPYRWLEDDVRQSDEVRAWVEAQNKVTETYLNSIPERESIEKRLTEMWDYPKYSSPGNHGGKYFFFKNDGLQDQSVLYMMDKLQGTPEVLLDPNEWSKDGTVALSATEFSDDAKYLAYSVAEGGSDWHKWKVLDVSTQKPLADELQWSKFSGASWTNDGKGFFYCRYPEPEEGAEFQSLNKNMKVMYHRVGTPQSEDTLVYHTPDHPEWGFQPEVSEDGRYLIITIWKGTDDRYRVAYKDLEEPFGFPIDLITEFENDFTFIDNDGPVFYFLTDWNAPMKRIIAIDTRQPSRENWTEIIPETENNLVGVNTVGNMFVCRYLKDAQTQVKLHRMDGTFVREVEFPGIGSAGGFGGKRTDTETFYSFSSFDTPPSIYRYDMITGESELYRRADVPGFNPDDYEVKQIFYTSKDGTKVPMFITAKKGLKLDGNNPVLLYGYGGFNIPLTPGFSTSRAAWLELGGVLAVANLRGGGEYGKEWHKAGTKLQKQNVFDDFIAAAEWLIENGYTKPEKLAIQGGSNGGLLVGACMTQRPELYGACLPAVGVMDMLRFHKFTAGRFWVDDYGSAEDPEEFKALYAYSPYHNLKKGVAYPATMVTTADTDDRVVPGHSFKFIARLQYCQDGSDPVIARIETRAGHGAGKPTSKIIEEIADQWAFLVHELEMSVSKE